MVTFLAMPKKRKKDEEEKKQHQDPYADESADEDAQRAAESGDSEEEVIDAEWSEREVVIPPGEVVPRGLTPEEKTAEAAEEHKERIREAGGIPRGKY